MIIVSCATKTNEATHPIVIIAGKVRHYNPDNLKISLGVNRIGLGPEKLSASLDNNGCFRTSFVSKVPTDVWLMYKTNFLILTHPGDSIYVEFDGSRENRPDLLKKIKFSGDASGQNQKAAEFQRMYYSRNYYSNWDKSRQGRNIAKRNSK